MRKRKNKKEKWILLFLVIPVALLIYGIGFAICVNRVRSFFNVPLYNILNVFIAIFFAYYLTQVKNDRRKKIDVVESLLKNIVDVLSDKRMYQISSINDINYIRITQRTVKNKLELLFELFDNLKLSNDRLKECKDKLADYWDIVSDNIDNVEKLNQSEKILQNGICRLCDVFDVIRVELYI